MVTLEHEAVVEHLVETSAQSSPASRRAPPPAGALRLVRVAGSPQLNEPRARRRSRGAEIAGFPSRAVLSVALVRRAHLVLTATPTVKHAPRSAGSRSRGSCSGEGERQLWRAGTSWAYHHSTSAREAKRGGLARLLSA